MPDTIETVSDANFESEVLESPDVVIVHFRADWCGPCRAVDPVVEELADAYADDVKVVELDVDSNPRTAGYYGFRSLPTFVRVEDGAVVDRILGAVPKPELEELFADRSQQHADDPSTGSG